MEKPRSWMFLAKFSLPIFLSLIYLFLVYLFFRWKTLIPLMGVYFFPPLGKESVIPMGVGLGIHPSVMAFSIAYVDIVVGLFIAWNFDLLKKIPLLGEYVETVEKKGRKVLLNKKWLRRFAFYGLILIVMFPFQGSGAVTVSVIGRLMGLRPRKVLSSIVIGAVLGCFLVAYSTDLVVYLTKLNVIAGALATLFILIFLYLVYRKFWKIKT